MRKNIEKSIVKTSLYWLLIFLVGCSFFLDAVRLISVRSNIENRNVIKKFCSYELSKIRTGRNTSYLFILDDGERIWVNSELLENKDIIHTHKQLEFTYVEPMGGARFSYTCLEIVSHDGNIKFVNQVTALREVVLGIWADFLISTPILVFCTVPLVYKYALLKNTKVHRARKRRSSEKTGDG